MQVKHSFTLGNQIFTLETGELARQASGAVRLEVADTVLLAAVAGSDGLLHISQISEARVEVIADHLTQGQVVRVKVLEADERGKLRLSMKAVAADAPADAA